MQFVWLCNFTDDDIIREMRKLFLFDCFGVVVSDVSTLWLNKRCNEQQKEYARKVLFRKVDTGVMSQDELYGLLSDQCGMDKQSLVDEWESLVYVKQDTVEVIKRIRQQGDAVALLSNASVEYIDYLFAKFDLYQYFDKIFVSARYKTAKPDREFYQICLDNFSEKFDEIFFTDDNPVNLKNLEELGITPILFTSAEQFEKDIKR